MATSDKKSTPAANDMTFRQSMKWLHTWVGLMVGWVLFFMFITGTAGYFDDEITRWMEPERPLVAPDISTERLLDLSQTYLTQHAAGVDNWVIKLPSRRDGNLKLKWREPAKQGENRGKRITKILDPTTGVAVPNVRATGGGYELYSMHYALQYLPNIVSYWIVGFCTMLMLLAVITGVIFHKKIFSDFFTFRAKKGLIGWLDIHNVLSVAALPFHFMITYSGLIFFLGTYLVLAVNISMTEEQLDAYYDQLFPDTVTVDKAGVAQPLVALSTIHLSTNKYWSQDTLNYIEVDYPLDANARVKFVRHETDISYNPNDELFFSGTTGQFIDVPARDYSVVASIDEGFISLHEGHYAGPVARWIYILLGLMGASMVASGSILWVTKRKPKQLKKTKGPDFGYRLVDQLNIGTFVGLPIAIAMYFWANRLLPVDFAAREEWEIHMMFISWGILLLYPAFRPAGRAWFEQLYLAAVVFSFIPVLNWLTTDKHLGVTLPASDWNLAGFDLTMLVIGGCFAFTANKVKQRQRPRVNVTEKRAVSTTAVLTQNKEVV